MVLRNIVWVVLFVGLTIPVAAQDGLYYPGSVWSRTGTVVPFEPNNLVSIHHAEQGVAYRGAELFVHTTAQTDSQGFAWNRHIETGLGLRFTQSVKTGMVRAGILYLADHRFPSRRTATQPLSLFVEAWFGWRQAAPPSLPPSPYLGGR